MAEYSFKEVLLRSLRLILSKVWAPIMYCILDANETGFDSTGGRRTGALDVVIVQQDGPSKLLDSSTGEVDLQFN
jgi:hypothetical protein